MSNQPLVSVIIIFLNAEKFLQEAIDSVFAQSYQNFELLLVDDGSTDGSTKIAKSYIDKYSNQVRYLEHKNHQNCGISATRNLGVRSAEGEYIAFLDADDVWLPQTLEEQLITLESHPDVAMVYGGLQYWYSWTGREKDRRRDFIRYPAISHNTPIQPPKLFPVILETGLAPLQSTMFRKCIFEKIGGYEDAFRGLYDDQVFFIKLSLNFTVLAVDKYWFLYRQHPQSTCAVGRRENKNYQARKTFLLWIKQYLLQEKITNWLVWLNLQKEFLWCLNSTMYEISIQPTYRWRIWYIIKLILMPILPLSLYQRLIEAIETNR